jgi:glycosyltransferase involved in cell wall biosynthesis
MTQERRLVNVIFANSPYEEMDQPYSIAYASIVTLRNIEVANGMRLSKICPSLSCGVPVIYSGFGEAAELLTANQCGLAVEPEKPALLAQAVKTLASQPSLRSDLARSGRRLVCREYSWSTIVQRWLKEIGFAYHSDGAQSDIAFDQVDNTMEVEELPLAANAVSLNRANSA